MKLRFLAPVLVCATAATAFTASDARACGGCFVPPTETTVVTGHRMALAISTEQTVLWDQIQYSGDPAEFAWVLPVKPGAYIEASTDAWFETLEAATAVQVQQPTVDCHEPFSFGCAGQADELALSDRGGAELGGGLVEVVHRGSVGPYDTVTLSTETPGALNDWLTDANFSVDPATQPVIDAYVKDGFDFIALRLKPGKDVREMKPVRVVTPGASPVLPLRMVAVGSGAEVAITLFVIAEGRWAAENFANTRVPFDLLAWDFAADSSNYGELRRKALGAEGGGASWLTAYAQPGALLAPVTSDLFFGGNVTYGFAADGSFLDTIAETYLNQGIVNKETGIVGGLGGGEQECFNRFSNFSLQVSQSSAPVVDPCPKGVPSNDPTCDEVDPTTIDAREFECGKLDDLAVALTGTHPRDVWLTRLEAALPQSALKTDLILEAAEKQLPVENWVQARIAVNAEQVCESIVPPVVWPRGGGDGKRSGTLVVMWFAGLALAAATARRASRQHAGWAMIPIAPSRRRR